MISVPWSLMLALPLEPDAPERDCSLLVDSRDWAIDHSFFHHRERPRGRPPERSSSLVQRGRAGRGRNGLCGNSSHKLCRSIGRRVFVLTGSAGTRAWHSGAVYVPRWHVICVTSLRAGGNHYALAVVALLRGVQVSPFPPLALVPTETPAAIPAGVSPCLHPRPVGRSASFIWRPLALGEVHA